MKNTIYFTYIILCLFSVISQAQWGPDVRLTNNSAESRTSFNNAWCISASGSVVHAVWHDLRDGNPEIYYKRSTDGGVVWGTDTRLTNNSASSFNPSVAVSGSVVHMAWRDLRDGNFEIYYKRSTDGGVSWGTDTRLTNNTATSWYPSVAVSGLVVHVVWQDYRDGNFEIYYKRSANGGVSWGADTRLSNNSAFSEFPSVAVSGLVVHVVWHDNRDGNYEIYYKRSTDGGVSWGTETRLTNNSAWSGYSSVAISSSAVHVAWQDERDGNLEIYYKRSTDGGVSWGTDTRLTNNSARSWDPSLAVSGPVVHLIWADERNGNLEIYYKRSTDGGVSWGTDTRLTNNFADSWHPSVAVSGSVVHVIWEDSRDGNWEIYYKRDPTGNLLPPGSAPVLFSPGNNTQGWGVNLTLVWYKIPNATNYHVQLSTDSLFNAFIINDSTLIDSVRTVSGLTDGVWYYWRVRGRNAAGSGPWSSVWRFRTGFVGIKPIGTEIPKEFRLYDNYPNPFNPTTKIRFDIPGQTLATLTVYDVLGREVATLVNDQLNPGIYELEFDGLNYPSGVYYYRLTADKYVETRKMILVK